MALESADTIWGLNAANPPGSDVKSEGDNHLRLIKSVLQGTFITDTEANRPAAGTSGRLFFSSDTLKIYRDNGASWDEIPSASGLEESGTRMFFQQTAAPTGWTKDTSINDEALRIVSGTVGNGGTNAFTTALNSARNTSTDGSHNHGGTNNTTLSVSQIPSHNHALNNADNAVNTGGTIRVTGPGSNIFTSSTGSGGSHSHSISTSGSHNHSLNLDVKYRDCIIATKD